MQKILDLPLTFPQKNHIPKTATFWFEYDRVVNGVLETNVALPGLVVQYSTDNGNTWSDVTPGLALTGKVVLATR